MAGVFERSSECVAIMRVDQAADLRKARNVGVQLLQHCRAIGEADVAPHFRRAAGNARKVAEATGGKLVAAGYRGFSPEATIVGDAETVAKAFEDLAGLGFTDIIIRNLVPDQDKALASTARLAEVKSWLG